MMKRKMHSPKICYYVTMSKDIYSDNMLICYYVFKKILCLC